MRGDWNRSTLALNQQSTFSALCLAANCSRTSITPSHLPKTTSLATQQQVAALAANLANTLLEQIASQQTTNVVLAELIQEGSTNPLSSDTNTQQQQHLVASQHPLEATDKQQRGGEGESNQQTDIQDHTVVTAAVLAQTLRDMRDQIYCTGSLLAAVQSAKLFGDCKHFVDMPLKTNAENTLTAWNLLLNGVENAQIDLTALSNFVQDHFEQPGGELEDHQPSDFNAEEQFSGIVDPNFRSWAQELHRKWPTLCRRVSEKVLSDPNRYSLIALPKPFVVPGGRFREMYYWDSFFTIKGLLASGMFATVRGMIENMGHLIDQYGFVPNGNRVYYLNRSQPPLLTWCVHAYYLATQDVEFVRSAMSWLEKEMKFFTTNKKFSRPDWKSYLFRYHVVAQGPRPESYREDMESAEHIQDLLEKCRLWGDIAAAAESGRDFSARWFENNPESPMSGKMGSTRTSSILPVDLNSIICGNLKIFAEFYALLGDQDAAKHSMEQFELMRETIHKVFWNEEHGCWFDWDIITQKHIDQYYDTNFFPLFTGCTHEGFDGKSVVNYLAKAGVLAFPGGVPSSLITSGQQWDFPNAWAPTTWVIINGLRASGQTELARTIAEKWIKKNYVMWKNNGGRMYEKYNVASGCYKSAGGGGEYEVQEGFGWTNGVILDLLKTYQSEMNWKDNVEEDSTNTSTQCECCRPQPQTVVVNVDPAVLIAAVEGAAGNVPAAEAIQEVIQEAIINQLNADAVAAAAMEPQTIFIHSVPTKQIEE